ncbi:MULTISPECIES: ECs_2282 family putative zinc-binding protein [unclassified Agarivorans]|uniref:ECs_2282 family putative zinc-binding protein n=1 Tax=unclassified Agarivorans TaxID=2636026 RepID=UPI003D7F016C
MKDEKYNRSIGLQCPTCGCTSYEYEHGVDETIEVAKCASCGREITKDELFQENSENIQEHISEVGKQVTDDLAKELKASLKKAFKGSKNIRIK